MVQAAVARKTAQIAERFTRGGFSCECVLIDCPACAPCRTNTLQHYLLTDGSVKTAPHELSVICQQLTDN